MILCEAAHQGRHEGPPFARAAPSGRLRLTTGPVSPVGRVLSPSQCREGSMDQVARAPAFAIWLDNRSSCVGKTTSGSHKPGARFLFALSLRATPASMPARALCAGVSIPPAQRQAGSLALLTAQGIHLHCLPGKQKAFTAWLHGGLYPCWHHAPGTLSWRNAYTGEPGGREEKTRTYKQDRRHALNRARPTKSHPPGATARVSPAEHTLCHASQAPCLSENAR